jgi:hypothetical protein
VQDRVVLVHTSAAPNPALAERRTRGALSALGGTLAPAVIGG